MKPILQLALDFVDLKRALKSARAGIAGGVDWLEAGTPLIKSEGLHAVRELRKLFPDSTIVADMKIMDYTQMEFTDGFSYDYIVQLQNQIDDLMTTAIDYHIGTEIQIPNLPVFGRAGFMYFQSPFDGDPSEFNKKYVSAGAGAVVDNQFVIDFAYTYGWWQDYGDNYGSNVSRTYQDILVDNMILTLAVRF